MAIKTTTSDPVSEPNPKDNPEDSQAPKQDKQTEAVDESKDTSQTSEPAETSPAEDSKESDDAEKLDDAEFKEWAAKKNLPLDDPVKIARMYRESEQALGKKGQQEGQLKAAVTDASSTAGVDDVQALRNEVAALSFYIQHPEAKQLESEMVKILEEKPWLASDLETVLDAAKGRSGTEAQRLAAERQAGKKEALAQAEKSGRAAPPKASASSSTDFSGSKITAENVDALVARNGQKWFKDHYDEINAALATEA